ncbi:hypothetical protein AX15_001369 [Amanita polypyramis BW_CC]|nr:hypothetical protein AX15_001369 [Amanita polypyramis BW_CC]
MLKVNYSLCVSPPPDADTSGLNTSRAHELQVKGDKDSYKNYYDGLREALAKARNAVGDELTKWKELVGKDEERLKGLGRNGKEEEEEEEPEEEEEQVG